jgi:DNA polymerase
MNALEALYAAERERIAALAGESLTGDYANPVFGEGEPNSPVMLIGEAPGREEAQLGHPFVGKAGKQLDALLVYAGIARSSVFVTNAVKFRPTWVKPKSVSNRTPSRAEALAALPVLRSEIALVAPRLIATLGNTPLASVARLCGARLPSIGEAHGRPAFICIEGIRYTLFPLYHPASGIYDRV